MEKSGLTYAVLGSGSEGNSYYFDLGDWSFVIDNGFSYKEWVKRLESLDLSVEKIKFIFLTHGHGDHFRGIPMMGKKHEWPLFLHPETFGHLRSSITQKRVYTIEPFRQYTWQGLKFTPLEVSHDFPGTLGFNFEWKGMNFSLITDTGQIDDKLYAYIEKSQLLFLEANYCPEALDKGPYPLFLKKRIHGITGHLSNGDSIALVNKLFRSKNQLKRLYFCHLSKKNNSPKTLLNNINAELSFPGYYKICENGKNYKGSIRVE